jgi:hypothetical protein
MEKLYDKLAVVMLKLLLLDNEDKSYA